MQFKQPVANHITKITQSLLGIKKKKKGQSTTSTTAKRVSSERGQCDSSADQSGARPAGSRDPVVRPLIYIRLMASCLLRGDNLTVR